MQEKANASASAHRPPTYSHMHSNTHIKHPSTMHVILYEADRIKIHDLPKREFMENIKLLIRTEKFKIFYIKRDFISF